MKSILSHGDKSVHFAIRYIAIEIPKTEVREARPSDFSMGFRFSNSIPTARRIPGEKSREHWLRTANITTPSTSVWLYSFAEKWMNVIYSFLFSTIGPQSSSISLISARSYWRTLSPGWINRACLGSKVRKGRRVQMSQEKIRFTVACSWGESVEIRFSILPYLLNFYISLYP